MQPVTVRHRLFIQTQKELNLKLSTTTTTYYNPAEMLRGVTVVSVCGLMQHVFVARTVLCSLFQFGPDIHTIVNIVS